MRPTVVIRGAEVHGARCDVRIVDGRIAAIAANVHPDAADRVVDAGGGALIPGLHDHHLHLLAMAAAADSTPVGPPAVAGPAAFAAALRAADRRLALGGWLRATGYHESVAGPLDRAALDALLPDRPARVQHRS